MYHMRHSTVTRLVCLLLTMSILTGCNALRRLSEVGEEPKLSPVVNPVKRPEYRAVTFPMPNPQVSSRQANSLWRPGSRAFFRDQRASRVGDILTVTVNINDTATLENATNRTRGSGESLGIPKILGFETELDGWVPKAFDATNAVDLSSTSSTRNGGDIDRSERITSRIAAVITQVLPNGNLVLSGRQEIRVNYELRQMQVAGVIRPEDISQFNEIRFDQIAEGRIAYGGRGVLSDFQQPRYGQQVLDIILPF